MANVSGSDLVYNGISTPSAMVLGPNRSFPNIASVHIFNTNFDYSTNWSPDGREVCTNHKTKSNGARVCTAKAMEFYPTSFVVEVVADGGQTLILQQTFQNLNHVTHDFIRFPEMDCIGDVNDLEFRIRNLQGGKPGMTIHNLHLDAGVMYK